MSDPLWKDQIKYDNNLVKYIVLEKKNTNGNLPIQSKVLQNIKTEIKMTHLTCS